VFSVLLTIDHWLSVELTVASQVFAASDGDWLPEVTDWKNCFMPGSSSDAQLPEAGVALEF
jgi:hypothetical protein